MSAFHLLNVSPESSRADISDACEDASFNERASEGTLQKAADTLTASKPRLYEEVSYWWGIPLPKIDEFIHPEKTIQTDMFHLKKTNEVEEPDEYDYEDPDDYMRELSLYHEQNNREEADKQNKQTNEAIKTMSLPALTRANLAAHLCENGSTGYGSSFADRLNLLIEEQKNIDTDDVGKMINHARKKSGVVPNAKLEDITNALTKLREEKHIKAAINVVFNAEHPGLLATKMVDKWRFEKTASGRFVADLIRGAYKSRIQPILHPLEQDIDQAIDILQDSPCNEQSLLLIERKLPEWDEYVQPLQLIDEGKGFDEKRSSEICAKLRDLSLHLHNNEGESDIALRIAKLLNKVFPELPEAAEILANDLAALENIVGEKRRDTQIKVLFQAFMNKVEQLEGHMAARSLPELPSPLGKSKASGLINALSALLDECTEMANSEAIWHVARKTAVTLHNEHKATSMALYLTEELLSLAARVHAPQSMVKKLHQDKMQLHQDKMHLLRIQLGIHIRDDVTVQIRDDVTGSQSDGDNKFWTKFWIFLAICGFYILIM